MRKVLEIFGSLRSKNISTFFFFLRCLQIHFMLLHELKRGRERKREQDRKSKKERTNIKKVNASERELELEAIKEYKLRESRPS